MRADRATSGVSSTSRYANRRSSSAQHVAPVEAAAAEIEPAKQRALQPGVRDLGALVDEMPFAIDANPRLPDLLQPGGFVVVGRVVGHPGQSKARESPTAA